MLELKQTTPGLSCYCSCGGKKMDFELSAEAEHFKEEVRNFFLGERDLGSATWRVGNSVLFFGL